MFLHKLSIRYGLRVCCLESLFFSNSIIGYHSSSSLKGNEMQNKGLKTVAYFDNQTSRLALKYVKTTSVVKKSRVLAKPLSPKKTTKKHPTEEGTQVKEDDNEHREEMIQHLVAQLKSQHQAAEEKAAKEMEKIEKEKKKQQNELEKLIGVLEDSILPPSPPSIEIKSRTIERAPNSFVSFRSLTNEISDLYQSLIPLESDIEKQQKTMDKLFYAITDRFQKEQPQLFLFGSAAQGFWFKNGDLDICMVVKKLVGAKSQMIKQLANVLYAAGMKKVIQIPGARVPIVKLIDPETKIKCDICINNPLGIFNSKLIKDYSEIDSRYHQLGYVIKSWAKNRDINDPPNGTLSSYAYLLLLLQFLQSRDPPVLPKLQLLIEKKGDIVEVPFRDIPQVSIQGWNTYYFKDVQKLKDFGKNNTNSTGELLYDFFKFYAVEYQWSRNIVCPRLGTIVSSKWENKLSVEDPFETTHNLGRVLDSHTSNLIHTEFKRAFTMLNSGKTLRDLCHPTNRSGDQRVPFW